MADIGYSVDVTQADAFTLPSSALSKQTSMLVASEAGEELTHPACGVTDTRIEIHNPAPFVLKVISNSDQ